MPLLARLFGQGKLFILLLLSWAVMGPFARTVLAHGNEVWKEYSYPGGMDAIALGNLTALLVSRFRFPVCALWMLGGIGTALLTLMLGLLGFSIRIDTWGLARNGLNMTILAAGTCMVITAVAQTNWRGPRLMSPLLNLGRRSYEIYLTHMFVVFALFQLFVLAGKPMGAVPGFFLGVVFIAGLLGEAVARSYSEPMNRLIRERWGEGVNNPSTVPVPTG